MTLIGINATCRDDYLVMGLFQPDDSPLFYLSYYHPFCDSSDPLDGQHLDVRHFLARQYLGGSMHPYRKQLYNFLVNPLQSGPLVLDGKRYASAALHCLQSLCDDDGSSIPFTEYDLDQIVIRTNRPLFWRKVLLPRTRRLKSFQAKVLKRTKGSISSIAFPYMQDLVDDFFYSRAYRWALQCVRRLLRRSTYSKELLDFASRRSFSIRSQDWPRQSRLARNAIDRYIMFCQTEDDTSRCR
ncbi:hypothetical protein CPB84DRAFT_1473269 [Gymnopilus junonius]|uniref:Uncharacterized protein n=1 Tax=Gymnopilus junonius TaxID=109634 RepID=A0A9P5NK12_GYMJU|nr:hypothetical protein CPB84DRAFT_1473269 [Gymnopilus junonius]